MKLWQKEHTDTAERVERFTVGKDRDYDLLLAPYDVRGSLAHVAMLGHVGLLQHDEALLLQKELQIILKEIEAGRFSIAPESEDIHSQIEQMLTERLGDIGKKIHSGRSRNDQVAVDIKLYLRAEIDNIKELMLSLFELLLQLGEANKDKLLPGYTHLQLAMPSSFGLWFTAWAESLTDDMSLLLCARKMADKNPLGSGAGYGSSFPLDRAYTTKALDFAGLHYNSVYAQMSRGKTERHVAMALSSVAATLARMSMDVCLYMSQNFGFISFPDELTTGSSIMPHKKNPDVFELIRAKCNRVQSAPNELALLVANLPSGYHRDMQLTKEILFPAIEDIKDCLDIATLMLRQIKIREHILDDERYKYLFTVERVNELVNSGMPFRDAYRHVGAEVENGTFYWHKPLQHTHEGSIGNLCIEEIRAQMALAIQ